MKLVPPEALNLLIAAAVENARQWRGFGSKASPTAMMEGAMRTPEAACFANATRLEEAVTAARAALDAEVSVEPISAAKLMQTEAHARGLCLDDVENALPNWSKRDFEEFAYRDKPLTEKQAAEVGRVFGCTAAMWLACDKQYQTYRSAKAAKEAPATTVEEAVTAEAVAS